MSREAEQLARTYQQFTADKASTKSLLALREEISSLLGRLNQKEFTKAWLIYSLASELLKYSIEDDYVAELPDGVEALEEIVRGNGSINFAKVESYLQAVREVALGSPLPGQEVEVRSRVNGTECEFLATLAPEGQAEIPVSSHRYPLVPILEQSLTSPHFARGVVSAFATHVKDLVASERLTSLCFIEKAVGPVGALCMVSSLVQELGLPASIFRDSYWADRAKISGYQPAEADRLVLVYDLLVTGDGIRQAAEELEARFGARAVAAVVLFGYSDTDYVETSVGRKIPVKAIGWHRDLSDQIKEVRKEGVGKTTQITKVPINGRALSSPAGRGRTVKRPRTAGGLTMNRSYRHRSITTYTNPELLELVFAREEDLDHVIDLCWEDPEFAPIPHDTYDGETILVPSEAVEDLRSRGARFTARPYVHRSERESQLPSTG